MDIILYSTHCPKCIVLEKKLNNANIDFTLVEDQDVMISKGFMSAPMLEVDGKVMNFTEANNWINEQ
jgi:hypothetical protein